MGTDPNVQHRHSVQGKQSTYEPEHTHGTSALDNAIADLTARVAALEAGGPGPTDPFADLPGWANVFADDFVDRTVAKGAFAAGGSQSSQWGSATKTADGRYVVFGNPSGTSVWNDTSGHGNYADSRIIHVDNGKLTMDVWSDAAGYGHTCVITPQPVGGSVKGGIVGGRSLVRARADALPGFKGVPLWWADLATDNAMLMQYGEIDGPEGPLNAVPKWYMHKTNGSSLGDQYTGSYPAGTFWQDWHDYVTEWMPGQYVRYYLDGVKIGEVTDGARVPTTAMHFNLQFETNTGSGPWPAPNAAGIIEIERVGLWVPA